MIDSALLERLKQIVGADRVAARRHEAEVYSYDASLAVGAPDAGALIACRKLGERVAEIANILASA